MAESTARERVEAAREKLDAYNRHEVRPGERRFLDDLDTYTDAVGAAFEAGKLVWAEDRVSVDRVRELVEAWDRYLRVDVNTSNSYHSCRVCGVGWFPSDGHQEPTGFAYVKLERVGLEWHTHDCPAAILARFRADYGEAS